MNTTMKNELINKLNILIGLHEQINPISSDDGIEILAQCQEYAINVGTILEQNNDGLEVVHMLEEYCECVYNMSLYNNFYEIQKKSVALLKDVYTQISNMETQYTIAFFPYKVEMWDSLESVWKAASKDKRCRCDVVVIPYFEFDKRDKQWKLAYDGNRFPDYVQVVNYDNYVLKNIRPDAAYIHYPYDDSNKVTTIHPNYYSDKIKSYSNKLIYIPYYVTAGAISDNHKHFPVYKNIDYYIAQSEYFKESCRGTTVYDKMLPLGSPKIDNVIYKCEMKNNVSEQWKKILAGKKVVMLNTTLGDILNSREILLVKLRHFFELVKDMKDIALIWRPHPLTEATYKSMREELYEGYIELKTFFMNNNIGIYDETNDISDTIAISDAYVGSDGSSVINMFGVAGRPCFIFNNFLVDECSYQQQHRLNIIGAYINGKDIYFVSDIFPGIFKAENICTAVKTQGENISCVYMGDIRGCESHIWQQPYAYICNDESGTYISPLYGEYISFCKCNIDSQAGQNKDSYTITCTDKYDARPLGKMYKFRDMLMFLPYDGFTIWKYNIKSEEWIIDRYTLAVLAKKIKNLSYGMLDYNAVYARDYMWMITGCSNSLLRYEPYTNDYKIFNILNDDYNFNAISEDSDGIWLADFCKNELIKIPFKKNEIDVDNIARIKINTAIINNSWKNMTGMKREFKTFIMVGDYIVLIPAFSDTIISVNKYTYMQEVINKDFLSESAKQCNGYNPQYFDSIRFATAVDDNILIQRTYDRKLAVINIMDKTSSQCYMEVSDELLKTKLQNSDGFEKMGRADYFCRRESIYFGIKQFLSQLSAGELETVVHRQKESLKDVVANPGSCGEKVHEYIMKSLLEK